MKDVGHHRSPQRNVGRSWLTAGLTGALAMGVLVAAPAGASATPQNLGTKTTSVLPAMPGTTGFLVTVRRQAFVTTTTLTSSQNPSRAGEAVTFTAQVTPNGTTILPTGTVVFREGTTQLGSAQLEGAAQASITTSSLTAGTHNITAEYQPGTAVASFATSTSRPLAQRVLEDPKKEEPKKENAKKEEPKKEEHKGDWNDEEQEPVSHHDHENVARHCKQYKNEDDFQRHNDSRDFSENDWRDIREACSKWWHQDDDFFTVINKAHRAHVEGDFEKSGGGGEHYDKKHHYYPEHYEKPYYPEKEKKVYQKPKPVVKHFAVTG